MSEQKKDKEVLGELSAVWDRMSDKDRRRVARLSDHGTNDFVEFVLDREERKLDTTKY